MNDKQRQNILDTIESYKKADFEASFKTKYKDTALIDSVVVGNYTISELFFLSRRAVMQLEDFLENSDWRVIPCDSIPVPIYGNLALVSVIETLRANLVSGYYEQAARHLNALVYFEMCCGFWQKTAKSAAGVSKKTLGVLEERAKLALTHADAREHKVEALIQGLEKQKNALDKLISEKKQEFETLRNNQHQSNIVIGDIKNTQVNITAIHESLSNLNKKANDIFDTLESSQKLVVTQIKESRDKIDQAENAVSTFNSAAHEKITHISDNYEKVKGYTEEARKMMHIIKDGTLTHSFNERKKAIFWAVVGWGVLCVGGAVGMGYWILYVFTVFNTNVFCEIDGGASWMTMIVNLIMNLAKTSPAVVLEWFILAQYKRERNLLEEYAYRAAVAATLTAYMDQLEGEEDERKCTLLMSTVEKLYTQPVNVNEKIDNSPNVKEISALLKNVTEVANAINSTSGNK